MGKFPSEKCHNPLQADQAWRHTPGSWSPGGLSLATNHTRQRTTARAPREAQGPGGWGGGSNPHLNSRELSVTWQMRRKAGAVLITPAPQGWAPGAAGSGKGPCRALLPVCSQQSDHAAKRLRGQEGWQIELWPDYFIMHFLFQTQPQTYPAFQRQVLCIQASLDIIGIQKLKTDYCFNFTQNLCRAAGQHGLDP